MYRGAPKPKTVAMTTSYTENVPKCAYPLLSTLLFGDEAPAKKKKKKAKSEFAVVFEEVQADPKSLPLLKRPTEVHNTYTRLDKDRVVKGPYGNEKTLDKIIYRHALLLNVFLDIHTLYVERDGQYLHYPIVKRAGTMPVITEEDYKDYRVKKIFKKAPFVDRASMGLLQLHKMTPAQIERVPYTMWLHFMYRYALGIGNSGLSNALWNGVRAFGINMDENRTTATFSTTFLQSMMFVKPPRKQLWDVIQTDVRKNRADILGKLSAIDCRNNPLFCHLSEQFASVSCDARVVNGRLLDLIRVVEKV